MANTIELPGFQSVIFQENGDNCDAVICWPEASGNLTWMNLHQRENVINLNADGAKELIKALQWFVKNQDTVVKECS